jgi:two-component system response regulator MprA
MLAFRLFVVVADDDLRAGLTRALEHEGFAVQATGDVASTLAHIDAIPDAMIIERSLPDGDGRDLRQALRARGIDASALFIVDREGPAEPHAGGGGGGDDQLVRPFTPAEAVSRIRALLRRARTTASISFGTLQLDPVLHAVRGERGAVSLTPTEFRVLEALAERRGAMVRRRELVEAAWPPGAEVSDNSLDQYIARVRGKLRQVTGGTAIVTTRGVGYRLE